ncbi:ParB/RepB/Spo0J family partition protein [Clostridium phoceensis]|uniref:ParB/RepB/Spo0J family partition protein n=1 Tax=Clostridium phoceensis TaxID=1650661 RepID=UPI00067E7683|nr:ParB/RepB/Spo0J family partition protein [Clostridium phoceensis]
MNKGTAIDLGLNEAYNDLFSTQEDRDNAQRSYVTDLPAAEISDFPNHPFKVRMDQSMVELADSVKQYGVLVPSLVRPMPDGSYQMVSGHRRKRAAELAGLPTVPCIIRELTDDEAIIVMVDSNLQREQILPSEKAVAYKMKLDAMKRQGQRTDLTSPPLVEKLSGKAALSTAQIGKAAGESHEQVRRYIRLTNLIPELLDMVDNSVLKEAGKLQMALRPAVELSYLPEAEQTALLEVMEGEIRTPSHAQAIKMRSFSEHGKLNPDVILSIMQEEKPNQVEQFKIPRERINKFFKPGTPAQKIEDTIVKALELYRKRQREMER